MSNVTARISAGETVDIVDGPDDICAPLLCQSDAHCRMTRVTERDALAAQALGVAVGDAFALSPPRLADMRAAFAAGTIRTACAGCEWDALCTEVAGAFLPPYA